MHTHLRFIVLLTALLWPFTSWAATDWKASYDKPAAKKQLTDRLVKYVTYDTQANRQEKAIPSSAGQRTFAKVLAKELKKNGAQNVRVDKQALVTAEIPSNVPADVPTVAFLAHLDTTPELSAKDVKPQVHENFKGTEVVISQNPWLILNAQNAPHLLLAKGHTLVTASGNTLLGADNKAGIAIIMTFVQYLYDHPEVQHGPIKIVFTPDEELGRTAQQLNLTALKADVAYTLSGSDLGELGTETFYSQSFKAVFEGNRAMDVGHAQNASFADNVLMASDFHTLLPRNKRPETTFGKQGFIWVDNISTQQNRTEVDGILRAFSEEEMQQLKEEVSRAFSTIKGLHYKGKTVSLTFEEQSKNMKDKLPEPVLAKTELAMRQEEILPRRIPLRGNTIGAQLSFNGVPAPGLFAGQYNSRSILEYADVDVMEASLRTLLRLSVLWAEPTPAK